MAVIRDAQGNYFVIILALNLVIMVRNAQKNHVKLKLELNVIAEIGRLLLIVALLMNL